MSASIVQAAPAVAATGRQRASFRGLLRAEIRKIAALRVTWALATLFTLFVVGSQILLASGPNAADQLRANPHTSFYNTMTGDLAILRIFCGIFLLILSAHVVGLEYQYGTIRILLGRGVGRLHLLGAKTLALALVGLALLVWGFAIELGFATGITLALAGGSEPWSALGGEFWGAVGLYLVTVLISMGATLLLGIAASVVGRSLAFGLAVGLSWFAVDNLLTIPLSLLYQFTHNDLWRQLSGYLLGLMLNRLPDYLVPPYAVTVQTATGPQTTTHAVSGFGMLPLTPVDGTHALVVIGAYALLFAATAIAAARLRDVRE